MALPPAAVWPIINTHIHKTSKIFTCRFVLGPLQFQSTGQNTYLTSITVILPVMAFKKNSSHLHSNQPKLSPVSELNSLPTKLRIYAFSHSLPGQELCPQTYSLSLPLDQSQVTHIPASINWVRPKSPKSQLSTIPLPDNCVMICVFQDGSLPFQYTQKRSSSLRQALLTKIANNHIQQARNFVIFLKC